MLPPKAGYASSRGMARSRESKQKPPSSALATAFDSQEKHCHHSGDCKAAALSPDAANADWK
eukprot:6811120-Alexandrium_andersonii.AAC.1